jgi:uncharacterized membrane protein
MPVVEHSVSIDGVSIQQIWETLIEFTEYPTYMKDVISVAFCERDGIEAVSDWMVLLNGSELTWKERDFFTPMQRIDFEQIEGDIEVWQGYWLLEGQDGAATVSLHVEFDLGIPSLADVLHPIGARAIRANCRHMLSSLRERSVAVLPG